MNNHADEQKEIYKKKNTVIVVESIYSTNGQTIKEIIKNMLFKTQEI